MSLFLKVRLVSIFPKADSCSKEMPTRTLTDAVNTATLSMTEISLWLVSITCFAFVACVNWPRFEFIRLLQRIHKTSKTIASMTAWDRFLCMNVCVFTANQDSGGIYGHHLFFVPLGSRAILCKSPRKNYLKLRSFFAYEVLNDLMR